jgi:pyruvate/2-oxoglutarate dehydrogenase complex dihydrolipoamide acyltransferase (E2) component
MSEEDTYTIKPFPPFRQLVIDGLEVASRKHLIHGMIEVDVTKPRQRLREIKAQTGESLLFTGFIIYCCAQAVDENKYLHAYRDWRNRLILFDDVDISLGVERSAEGKNEVLQITIRVANRKSVRQIHQEIRQAQKKSLAETSWGRYLRWYVAVPSFIRRLLTRVANRMPHLVKRLNGTVVVTSVGMFGQGAGWGIPLMGHTLTITVGGIVPRAIVKDAQLENREHLCLTVSFDHDIVDGAPAARFIKRFRELVESGSGLFEEIEPMPL